jgi:hypothetical protein
MTATESPDPATLALFADGALTTTQAVAFCSYSRFDLFELMDAGELPWFKDGKHRRIPARRWLNCLHDDSNRRRSEASERVASKVRTRRAVASSLEVLDHVNQFVTCGGEFCKVTGLERLHRAAHEWLDLGVRAVEPLRVEELLHTAHVRGRGGTVAPRSGGLWRW